MALAEQVHGEQAVQVMSGPSLPAWGDQGHVRNWFHTKSGARFLNGQTGWFRVRAPRGYGVLKTRGRRSGEERTACVRAVVSGRRDIVVATGGRSCDWLRNIEAEPHVSIRLARVTHEGQARAATEEEFRDLSETFCRDVYLWDRIASVVNQRGVPTARRIRTLH